VGFAAAIATAIQLVRQGTNERIIAEMNAAAGGVAGPKVVAS